MPTYLGVWSLGLFSPIFFLHILKKKKKKKTAIRAEPPLSLYGDPLSHCPHIKFLGITFDNRMTFVKDFEEILENAATKNFTA